MLIAFALAFVGALFAGQMAGTAERVLVVFVSMLIALFVAADPHDASDNIPEVPRNSDTELSQALTITSHPQLQAFIDSSADAI